MSLFRKISQNEEVPFHSRNEPRVPLPLTSDSLERYFAQSGDFVSRGILVGGDIRFPATVCYIDGMVSSQWIGDQVLRPLAQEPLLRSSLNVSQLIDNILRGGVYSLYVKKHTDMDKAISEMISGSCLVVFDSVKTAVSFETKGFDKRSLGEPADENVMKGARDAFNENFRTNTALVRRKIKAPELTIKQMTVGRQTLTSVALVYIDGLTNPGLVDEAARRIDAIDIDSMISPAGLEEYLADNRRTVFPQMMFTERSDKFCSEIVAGRVGILIDGLPVAYILPGTLPQLMEAPEDFSGNHIFASAISFLRYLALAITIMLPGFYMAVATFHHEMIPTKLALSIIESKRNVPFTVVAEVIGMLIAVEILIEAGLRLPKPIGHTVSIVGALVVGQAAVEAQLVSPIVVIIVAFTSISGFVMPNVDLSSALRLWRFVTILAAAVAGIYGIIVMGSVLLCHLCGLESFGVSYLSPFVSDGGEEPFRNALFRPRLASVKLREKALNTVNRRNKR